MPDLAFTDLPAEAQRTIHKLLLTVRIQARALKIAEDSLNEIAALIHGHDHPEIESTLRQANESITALLSERNQRINTH